MRLLRHLRAQEGITLVMAIGILGVLSLTGATLIYYSSTNARSANVSKGSETAYTLAEAGIAQALSVLNSALNPLTGSLLAETTIELEGGTVTYSGTLTDETWTITATGAVVNPTGAAPITRTLTRSAQVYGLNSGASVAAWSRWYADSTSSCLTIEDVEIRMPIATRGNLCMRGSAKVTGGTTTLEVGGNVTMTRTTT
jgi:Tfp pilus assembly protein PilX